MNIDTIIYIYIYRFAENATKERRTNYPNIHDANLGFLDLANAIEEMGATVQYVSLSCRGREVRVKW